MTDLTAFTANLEKTYARITRGLRANERGYDWRIAQLKRLKAMLEENDQALCDAMWKDLRKSKFECQSTEQGVVLGEIDDAIKKLHTWMKPKRVSTPLYNWPGRSLIVNDPYGLTLIIGAWNYPINLTLAPLVGAIVGGNACIIKPSEISTNTAHLLNELIAKYLDPDLFAVIEGGADETGVLLDKQFDFIFFTGSGPVGKIILAKAAPHLTPVVLELGGKSPAIIWPDADLKVAARRLAWGKFMNAGQTCIAPDYLIVHPSIHDALTIEIQKCIEEFYGSNPQLSPDYCRIINERNFDRLTKLAKDEKVLVGGKTDRTEKYIAPTLLAVTPAAPIMQEEIFGPYLPMIKMANETEIVEFINSRPKPLAIYVFTRDEKLKTLFTKKTSSGALVFNDVVIHMPVPELPFGGVGASGMGHYHGRFSFETFTHAKGVLRKTSFLDVSVRYAPYSEKKSKVMRWLFS